MNKTDLLEILECIYCHKSDFEFKEFTGQSGIWICRSCHRYYGLNNFILDCMPDDIADFERRYKFEKEFTDLFPSFVKRQPSKESLQRDPSKAFLFEENPEEYEKTVVNTSFWNQVEAANLDKWKTYFEQEQPKPIILDAGCGTGRLANRLAQSGCQVAAVDVTYGMLEIGRTKSAHLGLDKKIIYIAGDIWHLPFKTKSFSGLAFFGLLHHLESPYEALEKLLSYLKPKAWIGVIDNNASAFRNIFNWLVKRNPLWEDEKVSHATLDAKRIGSVLASNGFNVNLKTTCYLPPHVYKYLPVNVSNSLYSFADTIGGLIPFLALNGGLISLSAMRSNTNSRS